jgi:hypothetical protein
MAEPFARPLFNHLHRQHTARIATPPPVLRSDGNGSSFRLDSQRGVPFWTERRFGANPWNLIRIMPAKGIEMLLAPHKIRHSVFFIGDGGERCRRAQRMRSG